MGKVLDSNMFASTAGDLVSPRRPLGLPHAAEDGRVLDGGSGVSIVPVVHMSGTVPAVLPTLQQQHGGDGRHECQPEDAHSMFPFQQQTGC